MVRYSAAIGEVRVKGDVTQPFVAMLKELVENHWQERGRILDARAECQKNPLYYIKNFPDIARIFVYDDAKKKLRISVTLNQMQSFIRGSSVPIPDTCEQIAYDYGLQDKAFTDFTDAGNAYIEHCKEKTEKSRKKPPIDATAQEDPFNCTYATLQEALQKLVLQNRSAEKFSKALQQRPPGKYMDTPASGGRAREVATIAITGALMLHSHKCRAEASGMMSGSHPKTAMTRTNDLVYLDQLLCTLGFPNQQEINAFSARHSTPDVKLSDAECAEALRQMLYDAYDATVLLRQSVPYAKKVSGEKSKSAGR